MIILSKWPWVQSTNVLSPRHSFLVFYFKQNISARACLDSHGTISISCVNEAVWTWHNWSPSRRCQSWPRPWDVYRTVWHKRAVMCNSLLWLLPAISLRSYRTIWQATIKKRREKHSVQQALTEIFFLFLWSIWSPEGAGRFWGCLFQTHALWELRTC